MTRPAAEIEFELEQAREAEQKKSMKKAQQHVYKTRAEIRDSSDNLFETERQLAAQIQSNGRWWTRKEKLQAEIAACLPTSEFPDEAEEADCEERRKLLQQQLAELLSESHSRASICASLQKEIEGLKLKLLRLTDSLGNLEMAAKGKFPSVKIEGYLRSVR